MRLLNVLQPNFRTKIFFFKKSLDVPIVSELDYPCTTKQGEIMYELQYRQPITKYVKRRLFKTLALAISKANQLGLAKYTISCNGIVVYSCSGVRYAN
tara:strand:+ start:586 stop:879 length:294 start_codon:yes stop_codon:yes gene_type:complete